MSIGWSCGGLAFSAFHFQCGGRLFEPSFCRHVVSLDKKLYSTLSLSLHPGVSMGTSNHNFGGYPSDGLAFHPQGSSNIPSRLMLHKPELSTGT